MKDRAYLILGASGGIGRELSRRLAASGARLMLAGRNVDTIASLAHELDAEHRVVDATDVAAVADVVDAAKQTFGRLDGAANCVGSLLLKPAHVTTAQEWDATIATNLTSAFALVRAASQAMMGDGGSIVLVSTAAAGVGLANHEAIAAAKGDFPAPEHTGRGSSLLTNFVRHRRVPC